MDLSALTTSQAQPEPKRVVAAALKAALRPFSPSRPPKAFWMASPRAPTGSPPPFGREAVPEESVVGMAAGVVADGGADGLRDLGEVSDEDVDIGAGPLKPGFLGERCVQVRHVSVVVLPVVDFHRGLVDVRLEGVVRRRAGGRGCRTWLGVEEGWAVGEEAPSAAAESGGFARLKAAAMHGVRVGRLEFGG